jgi:hypothetical protein
LENPESYLWDLNRMRLKLPDKAKDQWDLEWKHGRHEDAAVMLSSFLDPESCFIRITESCTTHSS